MSEIKSRTVSFDIAKGITIILVIIGHIDAIPMDPYRRIIFAFHMPLFFILSGFFYKKRSTIDLLKKDLMRLVFPFMFTAFIYILLRTGMSIISNGKSEVFYYLARVFIGTSHSHYITFFDGYKPVGAIWFLMALFWCRHVWNYISLSKRRYVVGACLAIFATFTECYIIALPLFLSQGVSAMIFYIIGNYVSDNGTLLSRHKKIFVVGGSISFVCVVLFSHLWMVDCSYGCFPLDVIAGCFGTWMIYLLSMKIDECSYNVFFKKYAKLLAWFGRNSLPILCLHFLELHLRVWDHLQITDNIILLILLKLCFVSIGVLLMSRIKFLKYIYGIY